MEFFSDVGGNPLKPSLFELVAQEQLGGLLQPALKYVLSVSTVRTVEATRCILIHLCIGVCSPIPEILTANREPSRRILCYPYDLH
jgi:hypothetical protein